MTPPSSDRYCYFGLDSKMPVSTRVGSKGKRCLDAGCGGGRYSIALASLGAKDVIGVDLSRTLIADARRRGPICMPTV